MPNSALNCRTCLQIGSRPIAVWCVALPPQNIPPQYWSDTRSGLIGRFPVRSGGEGKGRECEGEGSNAVQTKQAVYSGEELSGHFFNRTPKGYKRRQSAEFALAAVLRRATVDPMLLRGPIAYLRRATQFRINCLKSRGICGGMD